MNCIRYILSSIFIRSNVCFSSDTATQTQLLYSYEYGSTSHIRLLTKELNSKVAVFGTTEQRRSMLSHNKME